MIYLKGFKESISLSVEELCKIYIDGNNQKSIEDGSLSYTIDDGVVNVVGTISLDLTGLDRIPIKFGKVSHTMFIKGDITSLENSPRIVGFAFNVNCKNLTSLRDGPDFIGAFYHLGSTPIDSIYGLARPIKTSYKLTISASFSYLGNVFTLFLNNLIEGGRKRKDYVIIDYDAVQLTNLFDDFDPLREDNIIYLNRLNDFLEMIGKSKVTSVEGYKCI